VADPGLNFGRGRGAKVQKVPKLATKLAKHSVKQRKTAAIGGQKRFALPLDLPLNSTEYSHSQF